MCTHSADWAHGAVSNIYAALGGTGKVELVPSPVGDTGIVLFQQILTTPRGSIRANGILWSPVTTPIKTRLCYDQTHKSAACRSTGSAVPYPYERATLNRILKDTILDDCLSDAVIYQGVARDDINQRIQQAVLQALATSGGVAASGEAAAAVAAVDPRTPLIVVTESLGSKVAFDAILRLTESPSATVRQAGERIVDRTTSVFMNANQIPILALGDLQLDGTRKSLANGVGGYPDDPLAELIARRKARAIQRGSSDESPTLRVVAFTDPNDVLSYILAPSPWATSYEVVDVVVSNGPTVMGLFEMPTTAHQGYVGNDQVRRLIACGTRTARQCP